MALRASLRFSIGPRAKKLAPPSAALKQFSPFPGPLCDARLRVYGTPEPRATPKPVRLKGQVLFDVTAQESMPDMNPESSNINDYLKCDVVIDCRNRAIQQTAWQIVGNAGDEQSKARQLYEWVRDEIPHSNDCDAQIVTCTASEVLSNRTGMCFSKSHLLAALLRSVQIPAGFCYQVLRNDPPDDNTLVLHGLNGIFLTVANKWVVVDARGNTQGLDAQFSADSPQLAFSMDESAGEFLYPTVFVSPFKHVIEKLKMHTRRADFGLDMPKPNIGMATAIRQFQL